MVHIQESRIERKERKREGEMVHVQECRREEGEKLSTSRSLGREEEEI